MFRSFQTLVGPQVGPLVGPQVGPHVGCQNCGKRKFWRPRIFFKLKKNSFQKGSEVVPHPQSQLDDAQIQCLNEFWWCHRVMALRVRPL